MGPAPVFPRLADDPEDRAARLRGVARAVGRADDEAVATGPEPAALEPAAEAHRAHPRGARLRVVALERDVPPAARARAVAALGGEPAPADAAQRAVLLDRDGHASGLGERPEDAGADRDRDERPAVTGGAEAGRAQPRLADEGGRGEVDAGDPGRARGDAGRKGDDAAVGKRDGRAAGP